jgi:lysophospholipid acyltransferase (LPLAT)-like uncharacterized protein
MFGQLARPIAAVLGRTLRFKSHNNGQATDPWNPELRERYIYALWHESLLGIMTLRSCAPAYALVSQSNDGEILSQMCEWFGLNTIRGSSTRGGGDAAQEVLEGTADGHILIAPDGPKGPRREVKRGVSYLASWSGKPVVPLGISFTSSWRLKTWDRFNIPKPFSTATFVAGPILRVPTSINKRQSEEYRLELENRLNQAQADAEAWAQGKVTYDGSEVSRTAMRRAA